MKADFKKFKKGDNVKCLPNHYPYNDLLLTGKLSANTRSWKWAHEGLVLLYASRRKDSEVIAAHKLPQNFESGMIVGYGYLKPVRLNSNKERAKIKKEFGNGKFPPARNHIATNSKT